MSVNLREAIQEAVGQLPEKHLADVFSLVQLLIAAGDDTDVEPEELWLLASGMLKQMVDETENAPPPVRDWRKHLNDL